MTKKMSKKAIEERKVLEDAVGLLSRIGIGLRKIEEGGNAFHWCGYTVIEDLPAHDEKILFERFVKKSLKSKMRLTEREHTGAVREAYGNLRREQTLMVRLRLYRDVSTITRKMLSDSEGPCRREMEEIYKRALESFDSRLINFEQPRRDGPIIHISPDRTSYFGGYAECVRTGNMGYCDEES